MCSQIGSSVNGTTSNGGAIFSLIIMAPTFEVAPFSKIVPLVELSYVPLNGSGGEPFWLFFSVCFFNLSIFISHGSFIDWEIL